MIKNSEKEKKEKERLASVLKFFIIWLWKLISLTGNIGMLKYILKKSHTHIKLKLVYIIYNLNTK